MGGCVSSLLPCNGAEELKEARAELGLGQLGALDLMTSGSLRAAYKLFRDADGDDNGKVSVRGVCECVHGAGESLVPPHTR